MFTSTKKYHVTLHIVFFTNEGLTKSRLLFDLKQLYTEINKMKKLSTTIEVAMAIVTIK